MTDQNSIKSDRSSKPGARKRVTAKEGIGSYPAHDPESGPLQEVIDERHEHQYEKDVEDRLRNTGRWGGDAAKSQDPGHNRDHEES